MRKFTKELFDYTGYDFSDYSQSSLNRRIQRIMILWKVENLEGLLQMLKNKPELISNFVHLLTVPYTSMFRDPTFFLSLRTNVIPYLRTFPLIRIWSAGCSTGEEAYSIAILLKEAGLLERALIYATDLNPFSLEIAKKGVYPLEYIKEYCGNYHKAGGLNGLSSYFTANYGHAVFDEELKGKIIFSTHNLVSDASFNSFQLILCRNVLIYFERVLQNKVIKLFHDSLENSGFMALGSKETLVFSDHLEYYKKIDDNKIWQKIS